jgi:serine/threonine-protein kinase
MGEPAPGDTVDQYELADIIARSGMATIFRARHRENGHLVALNIPHLAYASDLVFHERFRREEEIGQRLDHSAIIKILRPKRTSTASCTGTSSPKTSCCGRDGGVKLMDFGIALDTTLRKMTWAGLSQTVGTPDYMAPEQIKGKRGDARTDLYALGAMLYAMLVGEVPFPAENVYAAMRAKLQDDPPPLRPRRPEVSPALEEIVLHALERDPADRPESAFALREMLAHPESVVVTGRAGRRRAPRRLPAGVRAALAIGGALAAYGLLLWGLSRAGR